MGWKKILNKLLFPPAWLVALLTAVSAGLLTAVFLRGWEQTAAAYIIYVLSFYTLCVLTVFCVKVLPKQLGQIKQTIRKSTIGNRYMTDRTFRTKTSLCLSLTINLLYVGMNLWFWFTLRSWWFVVLAGYYSIMAVMRFLLVGYVRVNSLGVSLLGEWKRSRACAYILLLVNLSLSGAVLMILFQNRGYDYPGILIYVMALYTFYSVIHAIVEMVRYRKLGSPVLTTARVVSLSAAAVSLLNLETAMFAQFGAEMTEQSKRIFIILTGAGVSITVVTLSVILIVKATKEIRREIYGK